MIAPILLALSLGGPVPATAPEMGPSTTAEAAELYREMRLEGVLDEAVFGAAYERVQSRAGAAKVMAIADMSQPSTAERFYVFDLEQRKLVLRTFVAHGSGSGMLMAEQFSNRDGSHQTSLGLYRVGARIVSPKHGPALLLDGLDRGLNDRARSREVIIHGAPYVSADFIATSGRLGRSWGCPAVPVERMAKVIELLQDGGLLYVYGPADRAT
jgi:hypothetical protein